MRNICGLMGLHNQMLRVNNCIFPNGDDFVDGFFIHSENINLFDYYIMLSKYHLVIIAHGSNVTEPMNEDEYNIKFYSPTLCGASSVSGKKSSIISRNSKFMRIQNFFSTQLELESTSESQGEIGVCKFTPKHPSDLESESMASSSEESESMASSSEESESMASSSEESESMSSSPEESGSGSLSLDSPSIESYGIFERRHERFLKELYTEIFNKYIDKHHKDFCRKNSFEQKRIIREFEKIFTADFGFPQQPLFNQSFTLDLQNPTPYIEAMVETQQNIEHFEISGIFLLNFHRGLFSHNALLTKSSKYIPTNIGLLHDWFVRFKLTLNQVKTILKFLILKNTYDHDQLSFFFTKHGISVDIWELLDYTKPKKFNSVIMSNFDLKGLHLILFLISIVKIKKMEQISSIKEKISELYDTPSLDYESRESIKSKFQTLLNKMNLLMNQRDFNGSILSYACRGFQDTTKTPVLEVVPSNIKLYRDLLSRGRRARVRNSHKLKRQERPEHLPKIQKAWYGRGGGTKNKTKKNRNPQKKRKSKQSMRL